jgi:hypothetical protein
MQSKKSKIFTNYFATLGAAFAIGLSFIELTSASAAPSETKGGGKVNSGAYAKAKDQLPPDIYSIYRLTDVVMKSNPEIAPKVRIGIRSSDTASCKQLIGENSSLCNIIQALPDVKSGDNFVVWAIQTASSVLGQPNAYASSFNNQIIVNKSLFEGLGNDVPAQACVIAHELGHIAKDHTKQKETKRVELDMSTAGQIQSAINNARKAQASKSFWNAVAIGLNAAGGNHYANASLMNQMQNDKLVGGLMYQNLSNIAKTLKPETSQALAQMDGLGASLISRTMKDVYEYLSDSTNKQAEFSREKEIEADILAVGYLYNANLDPQACIRLIDFISRGTPATVSAPGDSHPGEYERKEAIMRAIEALPKKKSISLVNPQNATKPLPYSFDDQIQMVTLYTAGALPETTVNKVNAIDRVLGK